MYEFLDYHKCFTCLIHPNPPDFICLRNCLLQEKHKLESHYIIINILLLRYHVMLISSIRIINFNLETL
jgi:hypothetical protein